MTSYVTVITSLPVDGDVNFDFYGEAKSKAKRRIVASKQEQIRFAVIAVIISVFALSLGDAVIKRFSVSFSLWQIYIVRSLLALPVIVAFIKARNPNQSLIPESIRWTTLRSFLLALMWVIYYAALPSVPLSVAAAAYYTSPIFISLIASLVTNERISPKGWLAVLLGFIGILIILRPDTQGFNVYTLFPVLAAVLYALAMVLTRTKCSQENPLVLASALNAMMIIFGVVAAILLIVINPQDAFVRDNPFILEYWSPISVEGWLVMSVLAVVIVVGSIGAAIAYQTGPSSVVATFDYSYLAFSALWGFLIFSEAPDGLTTLGIALIAVAGFMAIRR